MPILKCTRTLVRVLGKSADKQFSTQPDNDTSVLGCWSAHLVIFARIRFVLFVNAKTLLTIFIYLKPKEILLERFRQALVKELTRLGVRFGKAMEETEKFRNFSLEKNTDRSVIGSMNELAFDYKIFLSMHIEEYGLLDLENAQELANQIPHVKREHPFPDNYVRELFGVEEQKAIYTPPTSKYAH
jgi:hypothetical protein